MTTRLTSKQKWQLALRLLVLYSPLLLYVNLPQSAISTIDWLRFLPFFVGFSVIAMGLYFVWITATDWIQCRLFDRFGETFFQEFNWLSLLLTILISLGLAILYILVFDQVLHLLGAIVSGISAPKAQAPNRSPLPPEVFHFIKRANNGFSVVIMFSAFYLTINARSFQQLKDVQLRAERLEKEAVLSQFEALKSQVSPHFLFNSLSILTSLVHEDADLSEQFIKQLSKAYRYILEQRDQELVSLRTELDFIQAYTFLLQIRFEHKFEVSIDIPEDTQHQYCIAPLSLQMLVENAVKHNRMSVLEPLLVQIATQDSYLIVSNPLQPRDQPAFSTGVGLRNITNRYSLLTDRNVWYGEADGSFVVKIPLLSA